MIKHTSTPAPESDTDPFGDLASSDAKLTVIQHSMIYCRENIGEDELIAFATLIDEVRRSLGNVSTYCQEADGIVSPLKRHLKAVHPEAPDLLDYLWLIDQDGKIQQQFLQELYRAKLNCKHPLASM